MNKRKVNVSVISHPTITESGVYDAVFEVMARWLRESLKGG